MAVSPKRKREEPFGKIALVDLEGVGSSSKSERIEGFPLEDNGGLDAARDEIHQLFQMIQSRQNAVDFSRFCLEERQRENEKLQRRVHRCKQELGKQGRAKCKCF